MITTYYCPKCMEGFVTEDTETIVETSMKPKEPRHD